MLNGKINSKHVHFQPYFFEIVAFRNKFFETLIGYHGSNATFVMRHHMSANFSCNMAEPLKLFSAKYDQKLNSWDFLIEALDAIVSVNVWSTL